MLFVSTLRLNKIILEKSNINLQLNDLQQELLDTQSYAATIANGSITMEDVANAPASVFSRLMNFMQYSTTSSMQAAQTNYSIFQSTQPMPTFTDATSQQNYFNSLFQSFYKQQMDQCIKVEEKLLNAKETKIQQKINKLQTKLTMLESEESKLQGVQEQSAQKLSPNYIA